MSAEDGIARIKDLGKVSSSNSSEEAWHVQIGCEGVKEVLMAAVRDLVADCGFLPIVISKSADGTPIRTVHRSSTKLPSGRPHGFQGN